MPLDPAELDKALSTLKGGSDLAEFLTAASEPSDSAPLVMRLSEFKKMYDTYERRLLEAGTQKWFVTGTPYAIDKCPRHAAFFRAGATYPERIFLAGNRTGKTVSGASEMTTMLPMTLKINLKLR